MLVTYEFFVVDIRVVSPGFSGMMVCEMLVLGSEYWKRFQRILLYRAYLGGLRSFGICRVWSVLYHTMSYFPFKVSHFVVVVQIFVNHLAGDSEVW